MGTPHNTMNKKIKLLGISIIATMGFFVGVNVVFAQNVVANCTSATLNGSVTTNGAMTNSWFEWSMYQDTVISGSGTRTNNQVFTSNSSFNQLVSGLTANTIYYYRAVAENNGGRTNGNPTSFRTPVCASESVQQPVGTIPSLATLLATEITGANARLNGLVFTSSSQSSTAWFEWGTNTNFGNRTQSFNVGALPSVRHSDFITGLVSGQVYYYRIVAENTYGKTYGTIMSFMARNATQVNRATVVNTPARIIRNVTVVNRIDAAQSLVSLTINGGAEVIVSGEKRLYRVFWQNTSVQPLKNVVLRITLPATVFFESTTAGAFSAADNSITVDVRSLAVGEKGDAFISAIVGRNLKTDELVVVTANMVYTDTKDMQGDAVAYVTHRGVAMQSVQEANTFGSGSFIPTTFFEWVILLLLILILILLGNYLYGRYSNEKHK